MCLSVYLGTMSPMELPEKFPEKSLGIEVVSWKHPLLKHYKYQYYLGESGNLGGLWCSCMLLEEIRWDESGPRYEVDETYYENGLSPFKQLRRYCEQALVNDKYCGLVSDDSGGLEQTCKEEEFQKLYTSPSSIKQGSFMFADDIGYPWRCYSVIRDVIV